MDLQKTIFPHKNYSQVICNIINIPQYFVGKQIRSIYYVTFLKGSFKNFSRRFIFETLCWYKEKISDEQERLINTCT